MINGQYFRIKKNGKPYWNCYCRHPELIENYALAVADAMQTWDVHHRKEELYSYKELIERNEYFDVSPEELVFLTPSEHHKIDSCCKRLSEAHKGKFINREDLSKKVLCVETGEVFNSVRDAERATRVYQSSISRACQGKRKTAGGYHWQYL